MSAPRARSVLVSMGSNVDPERNLVEAVRRLAHEVEVVAASTVFESDAVGPAGTAGTPPFHNAAVAVRSELSPAVLKYRVLRAVEAGLGRRRSADRNAPRPIDLDVGLYGDAILDCEPLAIVIPDPEILSAAHVAVPLADVEPDRVHPETGQTLAEIAAAVAARGLAGLVRPASDSGALRALLA